jgi:hypothetical protein
MSPPDHALLSSRSCIYVPIMQNGKVVDSQGFVLDAEDE